MVLDTNFLKKLLAFSENSPEQTRMQRYFTLLLLKNIPLKDLNFRFYTTKNIL